eukprot:CAMPEP_0185789648 /NCGR_PEP_ID=MMETSP1174-20130828/152132_1 /TAXON_ID=35687 /ORGANISM="Dictyocha speculum, Strain CCMP1381" /LENGTH=50 /DNA_ID=CAMNT_0028483885 /DNA_START=30 /DNA_END=182 /DNA_ORIENTATION=-
MTVVANGFREEMNDLDYYLCLGAGIAFSIGAYFYFQQWPNLFPGVFGPHE